MKCVIPGPNVKVFGRGLHALAKIGEDLYLEPQRDGLALRTMNSARSAFASFLFSPDFFSIYNVDEGGGEEEGDADKDALDCRCKISMRSAVWVFKSISTLEKTVASASIFINPTDSKVEVKFQCKFGVQKTFTINFLECDSLKAHYDSASSSNHLTARPRVLSEAALNFLSNQEEVTMVASPTNFQMRNFLNASDLESERKAVHTELTMQPAEFEIYSIGKSASVTYCLKELRSIIGFADAFSLPLSVDFDTGGKPIMFSLLWPNTCEAALVMATLEDDEGDEGETATAAAAEKTKRSRNGSKRTSGICNNRDEASLPLTGDPRISTQLDPARRDSSSHISEAPPSLTPIPRGRTKSGPDEFVDSSRLDADEVGNNGDGHLVTPPPSKRAKYLFKKCFDATFNPHKVEGAQVILAPDSDEDMP